MSSGCTYFEHVQDPTPDQRMVACKKSGFNLKYLEKPTFGEIKVALKESKYSFNGVQDKEKNPRTCLAAIYCESESYQHSKFKDDDYFNLMAFILNPNIENKLNEKAIEFIATHPYMETLGQFIDESEAIEDDKQPESATKQNNNSTYKSVYVPGKGWVTEENVNYKGFNGASSHTMHDDFSHMYM